MPRAYTKRHKPVELDACTDSPTKFHHFQLPTPDGTKIILGVCKYCGDNKLHPINEDALGYNNRTKELNTARSQAKYNRHPKKGDKNG